MLGLALGGAVAIFCGDAEDVLGVRPAGASMSPHDLAASTASAERGDPRGERKAPRGQFDEMRRMTQRPFDRADGLPASEPTRAEVPALPEGLLVVPLGEGFQAGIALTQARQN